MKIVNISNTSLVRSDVSTSALSTHTDDWFIESWMLSTCLTALIGCWADKSLSADGEAYVNDWYEGPYHVHTASTRIRGTESRCERQGSTSASALVNMHEKTITARQHLVSIMLTLLSLDWSDWGSQSLYY